MPRNYKQNRYEPVVGLRGATFAESETTIDPSLWRLVELRLLENIPDRERRRLSTILGEIADALKSPPLNIVWKQLECVATSSEDADEIVRHPEIRRLLEFHRLALRTRDEPHDVASCAKRALMRLERQNPQYWGRSERSSNAGNKPTPWLVERFIQALVNLLINSGIPATRSRPDQIAKKGTIEILIETLLEGDDTVASPISGCNLLKKAMDAGILKSKQSLIRHARTMAERGKLSLKG